MRSFIFVLLCASMSFQAAQPGCGPIPAMVSSLPGVPARPELADPGPQPLVERQDQGVSQCKLKLFFTRARTHTQLLTRHTGDTR